ncbi:MAG: lysophospholipase L1-like esterase [Candidatus Endobugula sp.]|jgi:lysophospholipase L1-like esterase
MKRLKHLGTSAGILLLLLLLLELGLTWAYDFPSGYYTYPPNGQFDIDIDLQYVDGIYDTISTVSFNSIGARSGEIDESAKHKIIAIGGSTTACFALRQDKTWTSLLNDNLGDDYWVGNFGRLGNDTNHHVQQANELLEHNALKDTEAVIFLVGTNDFGRFLGDEKNYLGSTPYQTKLAAFAYLPDSIMPFYRRLTVFKLLKKAKQSYLASTSKNAFGLSQNSMQMLRQNSSKSDDLPNLNEALQHYADNLRAIISSVKSRGIAPIFMTQPTMWVEGLDDQYEKLLLMGGSYDRSNPDSLLYFTPRALESGIGAFNDTLMRICKEEGVLYLDLALNMPKTTASFYDDCHFNENGAKQVADLLHDFLKDSYIEK